MSPLDNNTHDTTDSTPDSATALLDRYTFSSKPFSKTTSSSRLSKSSNLLSSTRQTRLHQTTISFLPSTSAALSNDDSLSQNDLFSGFSFTQEAVKKHKSEFSLVSKLSGKPSKSKVLKKLGSKITSRKSKEKYQLTISAAKQAKDGNNLVTDMSGLTLLKRRVVDQLYNNVMNPAVGAKILENAELAFPFVPKTTRSIERLRTAEELLEQYKVEFNDLLEVNESNEPTKKKVYCSFIYTRPKTHHMNLWRLSQLPSMTFTKTDILELHQGDSQYYNRRFVQKRHFSTTPSKADVTKTFDFNLLSSSPKTPQKEHQANDDAVMEDFPIDAAVNDPFDDMDDSVIITMEKINSTDNTYTHDTFNDKVILLDSSPANILPLVSLQKPSAQIELSQESNIACNSPKLDKSPEPSVLLASSPCNSFNKPSFPETFSSTKFSKEITPSNETKPVETVEVIEIPESPIAENDDFDAHFYTIEHAAAKFGLSDTSSTSQLIVPSVVHGNNINDKNNRIRQKQDFSKFTTPQLREQMDKWGFKPVRTRKAMIELLESCNVVVEPVDMAVKKSQVGGEVPLDLTVQVVENMSTGDMKKTLTKLGIKHNGSRSQMTNILVSWSQSRDSNHDSGSSGSGGRKNNLDNVSEVVDNVNINLSEKIMEAIKMDHKKHDSNSLWTRILCYEPISLDELVAYLEDQLGVKLDDKFVRSWCDTNGVTTTTVNSFDS